MRESCSSPRKDAWSQASVGRGHEGRGYERLRLHSLSSISSQTLRGCEGIRFSPPAGCAEETGGRFIAARLSSRGLSPRGRMGGARIALVATERRMVASVSGARPRGPRLRTAAIAFAGLDFWAIHSSAPVVAGLVPAGRMGGARIVLVATERRMVASVSGARPRGPRLRTAAIAFAGLDFWAIHSSAPVVAGLVPAGRMGGARIVLVATERRMVASVSGARPRGPRLRTAAIAFAGLDFWAIHSSAPVVAGLVPAGRMGGARIVLVATERRMVASVSGARPRGPRLRTAAIAFAGLDFWAIHSSAPVVAGLVPAGRMGGARIVLVATERRMVASVSGARPRGPRLRTAAIAFAGLDFFTNSARV